ncbi:MAG: hypothetical protein ACLTAF_09790 [Blautia coccoides]
MNALIDPYATAVVYQNTGNIHRSVGVDMTHRVTLPMDEFQKMCRTSPVPPDFGYGRCLVQDKR